MAAAVRSSMVLVVVLLLPACTLTYVPDQPITPASSDPPFILVLPLNGELQAATNPQFAWNAFGGAVAYQMQISTAPDFSQIVWDDPTLTITSTFLTQVTLTNFTTYYWRIYGIEPGGTKVLAGGSPYQFRTQGGGFTTPIPFATQFPAGGTTAVGVTPMFTWQGSIGADSYQLEVDLTGAFNPPTFVQPNIHVNRGVLGVTLTPDTSYYWRVLAIGQLGNRYSDVPVSIFHTAP